MPIEEKASTQSGPTSDCLLHLAVIEEEGIEAMEFLLMHGVPVNGKVSIGELGLEEDGSDRKVSALELAARGATSKAALLLRHGAKPEPEALLVAASRGRSEIVELLLEHGAEPDAALSSSGRRALHCAVLLRDEFLALALLRRSADPNATDHEGHTPLHLAAEAGYPEIAQLLLQFGASWQCRTRRGATALHLALAAGYKRIVGMLVANGAKIEAVLKSDGSLDLDLFPWLNERELKERKAMIEEFRAPSQGQKWYDGLLRILNKHQSSIEGAKKACQFIDDL